MLSRSEIERRISKVMPPILYCRLEETARRLLNPARRGGLPRRTAADETGVFVEWPQTGERFYINHHFLHNRYVWPEGLTRIRTQLLNKYMDREVHLEAEDTVVEAGANVGEFTTAAAPLVKEVYAFDPDPYTFRRLSKNVASFANIHVFNEGLGNAAGEAELFISHANSDSSFLGPHDKGDRSVRVQVTTVEAVMERHKLPKIDFLKVEAEGFEPEILAGAGERLKDVSKVAIDCGPERFGKPTFAECETILKDLGFRTWRREPDWMLFAVHVS